MTTTPTTNYAFDKITPGTEKDVWGPIYNTSLDAIDTQIKNRQNEAAAKLPLAGGTLTGLLTTKASATGGAGVNVPHGVAPTSPVNGDFWSTSAAFFGRINGTTVQLATSADLATKANVSHTHAQADITSLVSDLAAKAPLASPTLTGTPAAPTASYGNDTTQIATTAFVQDAVFGPVNAQTDSYTLVLTDAGKLVSMNKATANNLTVPLNSTVAFPIGTQIDVGQYGAGQTTIVATGGVTIRSAGSALALSGQYSGATLKKIGTDEWWAFGDLS